MSKEMKVVGLDAGYLNEVALEYLYPVTGEPRYKLTVEGTFCTIQKWRNWSDPGVLEAFATLLRAFGIETEMGA